MYRMSSSSQNVKIDPNVIVQNLQDLHDVAQRLNNEYKKTIDAHSNVLNEYKNIRKSISGSERQSDL